MRGLVAQAPLLISMEHVMHNRHRNVANSGSSAHPAVTRAARAALFETLEQRRHLSATLTGDKLNGHIIGLRLATRF